MKKTAENVVFQIARFANRLMGLGFTFRAKNIFLVCIANYMYIWIESNHGLWKQWKKS
jgi:hypothetical protein